MQGPSLSSYQSGGPNDNEALASAMPDEDDMLVDLQASC